VNFQFYKQDLPVNHEKVALALIVSLAIAHYDAVQAQQVSGWNKRPTIGEDQAMWDTWWRLSPEERQRNNMLFRVDSQGNPVQGNRPGIDDDSQIIRFRDRLGNTFRWVDLPPLYQKQDAAIAAQRDKLKQEQDQVNVAGQSAVQQFYDARDEQRQAERDGEALKQHLVAEAEEQYSTANFTCSEGNSWDVCVNHPEEKLAWLQRRREAVAAAQSRAAAATQQRVNAAVQNGNAALQAVQTAKRQGESIKQNADTLRSVIQRQNSGELWSFPRFRFDENAPDR
jgi:hypothetical protein